VEAERGHVLAELVATPLEAHEHARLAAVDEEADGEERLAAAGPAADERGPPRRPAAGSDLIESSMPVGDLGTVATAVKNTPECLHFPSDVYLSRDLGFARAGAIGCSRSLLVHSRRLVVGTDFDGYSR